MAKKELVKEQPKLLVRVSESLKTKIEHAAEMNQRSMNAEIVERLEYSFDVRTITKQTVLDEAIKAFQQSAKDVAHQLEVLRWMQDQQSVTMHILETIAKTDGNLQPEFMEMLRGMLSRRGSDNGFPTLDEGKP